jgi:hypothetical protein
MKLSSLREPYCESKYEGDAARNVDAMSRARALGRVLLADDGPPVRPSQ